MRNAVRITCSFFSTIEAKAANNQQSPTAPWRMSLGSICTLYVFEVHVEVLVGVVMYCSIVDVDEEIDV